MGVVKVFAGGGGGSGGSGAFPDVTFSGAHEKRIVAYGDKTYAEYELLGNGTLTVGAGQSYAADIMAVGAGGKGGSLPDVTSVHGSHRSGTGGGAGFPTYASLVLTGGTAVTVGSPSAVKNTTFGTYTAAGGGDGTITTTLPTGFVGTYYKYNDTTLPCGVAEAPGAGSVAGATSKGGAGANGFRLHGDGIRAQNGISRVSLGGSVSLDMSSIGTGGAGFGAGGGGQGGVFSQSVELKDQFDNITGFMTIYLTLAGGMAALGAQGVVLVRIEV